MDENVKSSSRDQRVSSSRSRPLDSDRCRDQETDQGRDQKRDRTRDNDRDNDRDRESHRHRHRHSSSKRSRSKSPPSSSATRSDRNDHDQRRKRRDGDHDRHRSSTRDDLQLRTASTGSDCDSDHLQPESSTAAATTHLLKRDDWMILKPQTETKNIIDQQQPDSSTLASASNPEITQEDTFFSSLGEEKIQKKQRPEKPDPEKLVISSRELNQQLVQGKTLDEYADQAPSKPQYGAPGYQWRMMKLKKVYETSEEEGRPMEEVAVERYGSMELFNDARAERQFLDDRDRSRKATTHVSIRGKSTPTIQNVTRRGLMFTESAGPPSSSGSSRPSGSKPSFQRPGEYVSMRSMPQPTIPASSSSSSLGSKGTTPSIPIPRVFTPVIQKPSQPLEKPTAADPAQNRDNQTKPPLNANQLNKLQAKVMRAELMGDPKAQELREEYERETTRANHGSGGNRGPGGFSNAESARQSVPNSSTDAKTIQMLPTLDGYGRLYDIGKGVAGNETQTDPSLSGSNRRQQNKKDNTFESRDSKTGEIIRYSKDDDELTLTDLVRQEKMGAGARDQKNMDFEMASNILGDTQYSNDLDTMDDQAERYARKKMRSDAMKRQFAINDYAKTQRALETCRYCWQGSEASIPPKVTILSSGTRAYLAIPDTELLTEYHCRIVPIQHHLSLLEADQDTWEEIKNFQKSLLRLAHSIQRQIIFFETVMNLHHQKHSFIEVVFVPLDIGCLLPGIFKQSIQTIASEWSTHRPVIDFSTKGFRNSLVPQLPYFAVYWDYKAFQGYGHIIESVSTSTSSSSMLDDHLPSFPQWFATEIVGIQLDLSPKRWRNPTRLSDSQKRSIVNRFGTVWNQFDWTVALTK